MTSTNDLIEENLDSFYEWVGDKKYSDAVDWCAGDYGYHGDDDSETIMELYVEANSEELVNEFINQLP